MKSTEIREFFFDFFRDKHHTIVPSAPMVIKDDPTLMFTNAGMNQFKEIFLGHSPVKSPRIANTQKCLRVSGKHNDLEEVGHDTYHHTMFEMLGNWSFGDYFKKEAITWAWELLTDVYGLDKDRLYVTVFGGDEHDKLADDSEAYGYWKSILPENRILYGSKKDNSWEMGDTGPCGPCSEIHVDTRSDEDRAAIPGAELVNTGNPRVIEIWNLVFIEFNRKADGSLEALPNKHVDTGMGFERLCMVIQRKTSNYDTDVFTPIISRISELSGKQYGNDHQVDVAMRVIADHVRAVSFAIADGQLPSNNKAGYVIRRILRRAVRYGFTFLDQQEPFINLLVDTLVEQMGPVFPELVSQQDLITKVITEEELSFLRTLSVGIQKFNKYLDLHTDTPTVNAAFAFELFDTYGFPVDLTQLMARENGRDVDMDGFTTLLGQQKERSRQASAMDTDDWVVLREVESPAGFIGYDATECEAQITKYRKVTTKNKDLYQVILDQTPFYAESGGQVGDKGYLINKDQKLRVTDTKKENNLIIHFTGEAPVNNGSSWRAIVDESDRRSTARNHSATHLMHYALRKVLGPHVEQKGSLVDPDRLRFDFSHYAKVTDDEILAVEKIVNQLIRSNFALDEHRSMPIGKATEMGAMALFGEKYGDEVRVIRFGESVELCGGTHVSRTGDIGLFKIISEGAIAAGVRRIEAITSEKAEQYFYEQEQIIREVKGIFKGSKDVIKSIRDLIGEKENLEKQLEEIGRQRVAAMQSDLLLRTENINDIKFISAEVNIDAGSVKDLAFRMAKELEDFVLVFGNNDNGKAGLTVMISESLVKSKGLNAQAMIGELSAEIQGGGGGQPHFATAGGKRPEGIPAALEKARSIIQSI